MARNVHHCKMVVEFYERATYFGYYVESSDEPIIGWAFRRKEDQERYEKQVAEAMEWDSDYDVLMMAALAFVHFYGHSDSDCQVARDWLEEMYPSQFQVAIDIAKGLNP